MWAFVVITAALLSGPVIPPVFEYLKGRHEAAAHTPIVPLPVTERLLTVSELQGRSSWELKVIRNEIYARHGRRFDNSALQSYFDSQPWYHGVYSPSRWRDEWLTPIERANAELIAEYQESLR